MREEGSDWLHWLPSSPTSTPSAVSSDQRRKVKRNRSLWEVLLRVRYWVLIRRRAVARPEKKSRRETKPGVFIFGT